MPPDPRRRRSRRQPRAGKDANLFISKGDPLEVKTSVTHVFIHGVNVGVDNRQEQLYRKYLARP